LSQNSSLNVKGFSQITDQPKFSPFFLFTSKQKVGKNCVPASHIAAQNAGMIMNKVFQTVWECVWMMAGLGSTLV
jgi:hypothetical protein